MILNGKSYLIRTDKKSTSVEVYTDFFSIHLLFETERLLKVVTTDWEFPFDSIGIPPELVIKIYDHKNEVGCCHSCHGRSGFSALYLSVGGSEELTELVRIVSLFNQLPSVNMTVVCPVAYHGIVRSLANDHLSFIDEQTLASGTLDVDVVLTYGPGVIVYLKQAIPTLVIDPGGFGGLISADTLGLQYKHGFMGRRGGNVENAYH